MSNMYEDRVAGNGKLIWNGKYVSEKTLANINKIIDIAMEYDTFPEFYHAHLVRFIETAVGKDRLTVRKYLKIFRLFIKTETGKAPTYYAVWDLTGIGRTLIKEREENQRIRVEKQEAYRLYENSRQKCKRCRVNIRKNGGCMCWKGLP